MQETEGYDATGAEEFGPARYLQLIKVLCERGFSVTFTEFGVTVASSESDLSFDYMAATLEGSLLGAARGMHEWLTETASLVGKALPSTQPSTADGAAS